MSCSRLTHYVGASNMIVVDCCSETKKICTLFSKSVVKTALRNILSLGNLCTRRDSHAVLTVRTLKFMKDMITSGRGSARLSL